MNHDRKKCRRAVARLARLLALPMILLLAGCPATSGGMGESNLDPSTRTRSAKGSLPPALPLGLTPREARAQSEGRLSPIFDLRGDKSGRRVVEIDSIPPGVVRFVVRVDATSPRFVHGDIEERAAREIVSGGEFGGAPTPTRTFEFFYLKDPASPEPLEFRW